MAQGEELAAWIALRRAGLGSTNFALLLAHFGTIEAAWRAPAGQVAKAGLDPQFQRAVTRARTTFDAERELRLLEEHSTRVYTWLDEEFPQSLRDIPQSPPVLFARGSLGPQFATALAVVGTRQVTPYGRQATETFVAAVARAGAAVISGLARGVDAVAHRVALEHGAPTVAVLAGGVDQVYPRENLGLAARILDHGCLVSEYPIGLPSRPDYFPRRNRILSGLARATLVVEAGTGSGALHTANWAFEQGRDVFAVPGSVFSRQSAGTNQLIREHTARLVATPEELCEELNLLAAGPQLPLPTAPTPGLEQPGALPEPAAALAGLPDEQRVLAALAGEPRHVDEIGRAAGLAAGQVSALLQILELRGLARPTGPLTYVRA